MFFGFANAFANFQNVISELLANYLNLFVIIYLDDILIFSSFKESHPDHVHQMLQTFQKHNMKISIEKFDFSTKKIKY